MSYRRPQHLAFSSFSLRPCAKMAEPQTTPSIQCGRLVHYFVSQAQRERESRAMAIPVWNWLLHHIYTTQVAFEEKIVTSGSNVTYIQQRMKEHGRRTYTRDNLIAVEHVMHYRHVPRVESVDIRTVWRGGLSKYGTSSL
jgi:hypothetical protein